MISALISLLIAILILGVVFYVIQRVCVILGAPAFVMEILKLVFLLIGLLYLLQVFGLVSGNFPIIHLN